MNFITNLFGKKKAGNSIDGTSDQPQRDNKTGPIIADDAAFTNVLSRSSQGSFDPSRCVVTRVLPENFVPPSQCNHHLRSFVVGGEDVTSSPSPPKTTTAPFAVFIENLLSSSECEQLIALTESAGYIPALVNVGGGQQVYMEDVRNNDRCIIDNDGIAQIVFERLKALNALHHSHHSGDGAQRDTNNNDRSSPHQHPVLPVAFVDRKNVGGNNASSSSPSFQLVGLNERLRFLRYAPGQEFRLHRDGTYVRESISSPSPSPAQANAAPTETTKTTNSSLVVDKAVGDLSFLTLLIYLNETKGGETRFYTEGSHRHQHNHSDDDNGGNAVGNRPATYDVHPTVGSCLIFEHPLLHHGVPVSGGLKYCVRSDIMYRPQPTCNE